MTSLRSYIHGVGAFCAFLFILISFFVFSYSNIVFAADTSTDAISSVPRDGVMAGQSVDTNTAVILDTETSSSPNNTTDTFSIGQLGGIVNLGHNNIVTIASKLIEVFLSILGVVFVLIIITAGFRWMLSGGDAEKIAVAKKSLSNAIIGLVIVLASYSTANFILSTIIAGTGK